MNDPLSRELYLAARANGWSDEDIVAHGYTLPVARGQGLDITAKPDRTDQTIRNADPVNPVVAGAALAANGALLGLPNAALKLGGSHYIDKARKQMGALGTVAEMGGGMATGGALGDLLSAAKIAKSGAAVADMGKLARIGNAAKSGAAVGTVYGATEGNDLTDAAKKAAIGGVGGGVMGGVAGGIGELLTALKARMGGVESQRAMQEVESERLHNTAKSSGRTTEQVAQSIEQNTAPDMLIADQDIHHAVSLKNQGDISPKAKALASQTLRARQASEGSRVAKEVSDIAGVTPVDANPQIAAQTEQLHLNDNQRYGDFFKANHSPVPEAAVPFTRLLKSEPSFRRMLIEEQWDTPGRFFVPGPNGTVIPTWEGIHRAKVEIATALQKAEGGADVFKPGLLAKRSEKLLKSVENLPAMQDYDAIRAASRHERVGREASSEGANILSTAKGDLPTAKTGGDVARRVGELKSGTAKDPANPEAVQAFRQAAASALGRDLEGAAHPSQVLRAPDAQPRVNALLDTPQQQAEVQGALDRSAQRTLTRDIAGGLPTDTPELTSEAAPIVTGLDIKHASEGRFAFPFTSAAKKASESGYTKHVSRPAADLLAELLLSAQGPQGAAKYRGLAELLGKIRAERLASSGRLGGRAVGGVAGALPHFLDSSQ